MDISWFRTVGVFFSDVRQNVQDYMETNQPIELTALL